MGAALRQKARRLTGSRSTSYRQPGTRHQVGAAQGITVHGGLVEARQAQSRVEGLGEDAPDRIGQGCRFCTQTAFDQSKDALYRTLERHPAGCTT